MLSAAKAQLGKPYVYGGNGQVPLTARASPNMSLTKLSDKPYHERLRHSMIATHMSVLANAKAGDLIFFGTSTNNITHCGIYLDNNKMIDAQLNGVITEATNVS
ncbi:C40 family peptidase [Levilactobacillus brevis]|nr:C40 family peptidase [Levilactobacillus brevis]